MRTIFPRILVVTTVGLALVGFAVLYTAEQSRASSKSAEFTGTVSDSMCGAKHMMAGDDAKCARTCVKGGAKYVLLVGDKVYSMVGNAAEFERLAGQKVTVRGSISGSTLQVDSIVGASAGPSGGQTTVDPDKQSTTVLGLVRDIACPIQNKDATARTFNLKCAQDCVRLGSPLVVLTDDGTLYTPISESMPDQDQRERLMPFLGKYVRITGQVFERSGTHAIAMKTIEEEKGVQLTTNAE